MMPASIRRIVQLLVVTLVINAGGWTFNREAVADVLFAEQDTVSAGTGEVIPASGHYHGEDLHTKVPCNHWCHAVGHFLGLFGQVPALSFEPATCYPAQISLFIPVSTSEGRFRPPRLIS